MILRGHALDLIESLDESPALIATDPPYAFGGGGGEHALSATVATVLRESARRLKKGRWMLVMCAASWRSTAYMVEAVRGIVEPVRIGTWCKPVSKTKVQTAGKRIPELMYGCGEHWSSWLVMALAKVRHELGQAAVEDFIAEMRKRGDLECTDEQAEGLAKP